MKKILEYLGILSCWNQLNAQLTVEPKSSFRRKIKNYYSDSADENISIEIIEEISDLIASKQYKLYKILWRDYPKSRKRYSVFQIEDLKNSSVSWEITDFLREKYPYTFVKYVCMLQNLSLDDFEIERKRRNGFENM